MEETALTGIQEEIDVTVEELNLLDRRRQIARLILRGVSQTEIAAQLGIQRPVVVRDMRTIKAEWRREASECIGDWHARDIATLEEYQREAWWAMSQILHPPRDKDGNRQEPDFTEARGWLEAGLKIIERRGKLFGYGGADTVPIVNQSAVTVNVGSDPDDTEFARRELESVVLALLAAGDPGAGTSALATGCVIESSP